MQLNDKNIYTRSLTAFFDSGNSFVKLPTVEYEQFINEVEIEKTLYEKPEWPGFQFAKCDGVEDEGWPLFHMYFGDEKGDGKRYWFYFMGQDYLRKAGEECVLLI